MKHTESSFYKHKTIEELAREQSIKPIKDISEIAGGWPEGADFDTFYAAVMECRHHAR